MVIPAVSSEPTAQPQHPLKRWWPLAIAGVLFMAIVGLSLSLVFLRQSQEGRRQAAETAPTMTLKWQDQSDTSKIVVNVLLNTQSYNIAGTELRGTITGVKSPSVVVSTQNPIGLESVVTQLSDRTNENVTDFFISQFAPPNPNLLAGTKGANQVVASFTINNPPSGGVKLQFSSATLVPALDHPEVTLQLAGEQTFTLKPQATPTPTPVTQSDSSKKSCNQNCATDTECQSAYQCYKGQCRAKANLEDANCSAAKDNGLQRNCNQYCANTGECQSQYVCYFNQCRNPRNVTNTNCAEPPKATPKPKTTSSTSGKGGTTVVTRVPSPTPTPKVVAQRVLLDKASPSPTASVSARPSSSPTVRPTVSASPKASSSPRLITPVPSPAPQTSSNGFGRVLLAGVAVVAGLGLFIFSAFKLFKR